MGFDLARIDAVQTRDLGVRALRPEQRTIIETLAAGGDALVLWPTGSGKSLCFQLPALLATGGALTIVLSPLIALMQDQVDRLVARGVAATCLHSLLTRAQRESRMEAVRRGEIVLLYVTPERFRKPEFRAAIATREIALLAVDEAHCISEWGHDFRPDYGKVGAIRESLGSPPTIALTATATHRTVDDIVDKLRLAAPLISRRPVTRENLRLGVVEVSSEEEKLEHLARYVSRIAGCGIVYCTLIRELEVVRERLARTGRRILAYHGELPARQRAAEQREFLAATDAVVVATNAFGMGIDKSDIRFIVHAQVPGSLESYAQEIGRAGRDGVSSDCELVYFGEDLLIQKQFHEWANPDARFIRSVCDVLARWGDSIHARERDDLVAELLVKSRADGRADTALGLLESAGFVAGSFERKSLRLIATPTASELAMLAPEGKRERDLSRLQEVVEYVRGGACRRSAIERYFEGRDALEPCGVCDVCAPRESIVDPTPSVDPKQDVVVKPANASGVEDPEAPIALGEWILVDGRHTVRIESLRKRGNSWIARAVSAGDLRIRDYDLSRLHWERLKR